ncbi:LacI family DNA-binding transcriptional regulator [Amycolatopsis endophytica]|uniref:DNA-binding LacI/PurR family transcriptional regulator n=1 Tax=Amycolatopsis endophytica TaxID=860233 RepID=A0A853B844_9PSEU|nr:LacI family DNA-binding transcriptional regulator [Amycolatopsis endophytica]NYI91488.1 DNA-binding LacI/PurR family transcriptional regulator [Amycolatopsis endophytica]
MTGIEPVRKGRASSRGRKPTMSDVAERAGVSRALVSLVFRGKEGASAATRQRVFDAAAEIGYRPDSLARTLRSNRTYHLGVVFDLRRPFEVEFVEHLFPLVRELERHLVLGAVTPDRDHDHVIDELLRYRCEGLIVIGPEPRDRALRAVSAEVAVVEVGRGLTGGNVDVVRSDDADGIRQAVDHLVSLGHRDIAHVDGDDLPAARERRIGYEQAMRAHGLSGHLRVVTGGYTEDDGARAGRELLRDGLPTAVVAAADESAVGLLDVMVRAGVRVPRDLSLVGYNDSRIARLPGIVLTSVRQDIPGMAGFAVQAAVERVEVLDREPRAVALPPRLVVRESTAAPRR